MSGPSPRRRPPIVLLVLLLVATAPPRAARGGPSVSPTAADRSLELVEAVREDWGAPALSAAVAVDGDLVFAGAAGRADAEGTPADAATRFRIASVSKPITGVLVLRLADLGMVDLDADVRRYVPALADALPGDPTPITLRHLLTHTAGLRHYERGETSHKTEHYDSPIDAIAPVLADPLLFEPGTDSSYTTYGYTLLQAAIEGATGRSFEELLGEHLLGPAGMESTSLDRAGRERLRATGFEGGGEAARPAAPDDVSFKYAGGGMASTPSDLVRLCAAVDRGALLEPETRRALLEPPFPELDDDQSYGFAVEREVTTGLLRLWHPGRGNGFEAYLLCYPEEGVAVAVATNQDWTDPWNQVGRLAETLALLHLPPVHLYRTPPQVLIGRMEELVDSGRTDEAVAVYRRYREATDEVWGAGRSVHRLAERLTARGELAASLSLLEENAVAYPDSWHTRLALAEARARLGDLDGAAEELEAARPLVPGGDVVAPLAARLDDLRRPATAPAAGRYRVELRETGVADRLALELRLGEGPEGGLEGSVRAEGMGELPVLAALAGGDRLWLIHASPYGAVELDLVRDGGELDGRWRLGGESGPASGRRLGPGGDRRRPVEEAEGPPSEPGR